MDIAALSMAMSQTSLAQSASLQVMSLSKTWQNNKVSSLRKC